MTSSSSVTADSTDELMHAYNSLNRIFCPYKFGFQQLITNDDIVQKYIDLEFNTTVKLLGI